MMWIDADDINIAMIRVLILHERLVVNARPELQVVAREVPFAWRYSSTICSRMSSFMGPTVE